MPKRRSNGYESSNVDDGSAPKGSGPRKDCLSGDVSNFKTGQASKVDPAAINPSRSKIPASIYFGGAAYASSYCKLTIHIIHNKNVDDSMLLHSDRHRSAQGHVGEMGRRLLGQDDYLRRQRRSYFSVRYGNWIDMSLLLTVISTACCRLPQRQLCNGLLSTYPRYISRRHGRIHGDYSRRTALGIWRRSV